MPQLNLLSLSTKLENLIGSTVQGARVRLGLEPLGSAQPTSCTWRCGAGANAVSRWISIGRPTLAHRFTDAAACWPLDSDRMAPASSPSSPLARARARRRHGRGRAELRCVSGQQLFAARHLMRPVAFGPKVLLRAASSSRAVAAAAGASEAAVALPPSPSPT